MPVKFCPMCSSNDVLDLTHPSVYQCLYCRTRFLALDVSDIVQYHEDTPRGLLPVSDKPMPACEPLSDLNVGPIVEEYMKGGGA